MTKRKDGLWQEVYQERDKYGGKVGKPKYFYGHTKAEVLKKLRAWETERERGKLFKQVVAEWEGDHIANTSYNGHRYLNSAVKMALAEFGELPISEITASMLNVYIKRLAAKGYAKKTVSQHLSLLRMVYKFAVVQGYCEQNPAVFVSIPRGLKSSTRTTPTEQDIETVKNSADKTFGLFALFLLYTGCRRGEALAVRYEDIDRAARTITINKAVYFEGNTPRIKTPKTKAGERTIILLDPLAAKIPHGKGYLFGGDKLLTKKKAELLWAKYAAETGITFTAHQLRHYFATVLYDSGIDEKTSQLLMGHSTIRITHDIYTHIKESRISEAAQALNEQLKF